MSLRTRFLILTGLILAAVLAVTDWISALSAVRVVEQTMQEQSISAAEGLAEKLRQTPLQQVSRFQDPMWELLELEPTLLRVDVFSEMKGKMTLADSTSRSSGPELTPEDLQAMQLNLPSARILSQGAQRQIVTCYPFHFLQGEKGLIRLTGSLKSVYEILAANARIGLYSMLVSIVVLTAAIQALFRNTVYRSVSHLVDLMHRFKAGDHGIRARQDLPGEFADLAYHLNEMLQRIEDLNESMEHQIEAATHKLARQNLELQDLNIQLHEAQRQLSSAERLALAGKLAATFAHEVGSPLSAISTHLQILLEDPQIEPRVLERLQLAHEQIDRVCAIVEGLLAAVQRSRPRLPVDLEEIILKVKRLLGPVLDSRQILFEIAKREDQGPFRIFADPAQIQQLFLNLFNNSLDAIQGTGKIQVNLHRLSPHEPGRTGQDVQIEILDTGTGIPPERLPHVFEQFYSSKQPGKGTGLGLAISKEIVEQHGGSISVRSQEGQGTCFTLRFPVADPRQGEPAEELGATSITGG